MATARKKGRSSKIAIGTWPTPEKRKAKKKAGRRSNPRAIDTVPLPDKPRGQRKPKRRKTVRRARAKR